MLSKLKREFDRLESALSHREKMGNFRLNRQMSKMKSTLMLLNKLLKLPGGVQIVK